jgi:hypothetical protein
MLKEATKPVSVEVFSTLNETIAAQLKAVMATEEEIQFKADVRGSLEELLRSKWGTFARRLPHESFLTSLTHFCLHHHRGVFLAPALWLLGDWPGFQG